MKYFFIIYPPASSVPDWTKFSTVQDIQTIQKPQHLRCIVRTLTLQEKDSETLQEKDLDQLAQEYYHFLQEHTTWNIVVFKNTPNSQYISLVNLKDDTCYHNHLLIIGKQHFNKSLTEIFTAAQPGNTSFSKEGIYLEEHSRTFFHDGVALRQRIREKTLAIVGENPPPYRSYLLLCNKQGQYHRVLPISYGKASSLQLYVLAFKPGFHVPFLTCATRLTDEFSSGYLGMTFVHTDVANRHFVFQELDRYSSNDIQNFIKEQKRDFLNGFSGQLHQYDKIFVVKACYDEEQKLFSQVSFITTLYKNETREALLNQYNQLLKKLDQYPNSASFKTMVVGFYDKIQTHPDQVKILTKLNRLLETYIDYVEAKNNNENTSTQFSVFITASSEFLQEVRQTPALRQAAAYIVMAALLSVMLSTLTVSLVLLAPLSPIIIGVGMGILSGTCEVVGVYFGGLKLIQSVNFFQKPAAGNENLVNKAEILVDSAKGCSL